jgi:hypothetical protein
MPAPSQLAIATGSLRRLLKEISTYHKELVEQEAAVAALEEKVKNGQATEDGNEEFMLKQQVTLRPVCPQAPSEPSEGTVRECEADADFIWRA